MAKKDAKPLTGRERKEAAMARARAVAETGDCNDFGHVINIVRRDDEASFFALRLYCTASDRSELDRLCKQAQQKRRAQVDGMIRPRPRR